MSRIAVRLARRGFVLRSGGADGSDLAFEAGATSIEAPCEIYLPWRGFNGSKSALHDLETHGRAAEIASRCHPAWSRLKDSHRKLHTRNVYQVLGRDLESPAEFVICWTPDGVEEGAHTSRETGGTGTAIRVASMFGVPVINLLNPGALDRIKALCADQNDFALRQKQ